MRRARHLVIFLRAPQRSAVKRRLARDIGGPAAFHFYQNLSRALVRRLGTDRRWRTVLAVTPDTLARTARFWPSGPARMGQGHGDLGARMARVMDQLPPGPVVVIGSDIPGITPALIMEAFDRLEKNEAVFGPSHDGGYWLVGLARKRRRARGLFRNVRWSTARALEDTRANLAPGMEAPALVPLEDVDDAAGYRRWQQAGASF